MTMALHFNIAKLTPAFYGKNICIQHIYCSKLWVLNATSAYML